MPSSRQVPLRLKVRYSLKMSWSSSWRVSRGTWVTSRSFSCSSERTKCKGSMSGSVDFLLWSCHHHKYLGTFPWGPVKGLYCSTFAFLSRSFCSTLRFVVSLGSFPLEEWFFFNLRLFFAIKLVFGAGSVKSTTSSTGLFQFFYRGTSYIDDSILLRLWFQTLILILIQLLISSKVSVLGSTTSSLSFRLRHWRIEIRNYISCSVFIPLLISLPFNYITDCGWTSF